ncbi:hypothetical protein [Propionivibrio limicola]|uniref:hypothetical protein n=1 Tax=Propionivibrio limicola TaxID=167645 RepID=UPI00129199F7|nr:hypothetical protein [Propionivibrio limicola]
MKSQRQRNPDGLWTKKPISLRLMPEEREEAERLSGELNITLSALARQAYLKGLPIVVRDAGLTLKS